MIDKEMLKAVDMFYGIYCEFYKNAEIGTLRFS